MLDVYLHKFIISCKKALFVYPMDRHIVPVREIQVALAYFDSGHQLNETRFRVSDTAYLLRAAAKMKGFQRQDNVKFHHTFGWQAGRF